jgi:uncharacterized protein (TIGR02996 family)
MRTFQYSDAKSHKFWNIEITGNSFTVTYGRIGTDGQSQTKTFGTPEKAHAEAEKLIREKTGKGYVETTPKATISDAEALERAVLANPHDLAPWSVYADYLSERADPRGEFMQVQLALEDESRKTAERKTLAAREKQLLKAHEREWLGPLAAVTLDAAPVPHWQGGGQSTPPPVAHAFARGWLSRLEFHQLSVNQARALSRSPGARLLRELIVEGATSEVPTGQTQQYIDSYYDPGPDVPENIDAYADPGLHALCRCPHLASIRYFRLGESVTGPDGNEEQYFNCHTNGELAYHLVKQMPNVEEMHLLAHRVDAGKIFALPMPNLRVLTLYHSNDYPLDRLAANASLANLTTLRCHPHAMEFDDDQEGAYIRLGHLRALCRSPHLKALTHLALRLTDFGDRGAKEIVESGILKRLRVLDLHGGCMTDEGAAHLAACPDLKNLEYIDLSNNALSTVGDKAIRATKVKANLAGQHGQAGSSEEGEIPEYLFQGDIE